MFGVTSWRHNTCGSTRRTTSDKPCTRSESATDSSNHTLYVNARISGRGARGSGRVPAGMLASAARIPPPGVEREEAPGPPPTIAAARLAAPESAPPTPDPEPEPASPAEPAPGNSLEGAPRSPRAISRDGSLARRSAASCAMSAFPETVFAEGSSSRAGSLPLR